MNHSYASGKLERSDTQERIEEFDKRLQSTEIRRPSSTGAYNFLTKTPHNVFEGHNGDITDISWSKSLFILSASVDKTVRLWHISKKSCLQVFRHPDIVTCLSFHPQLDRYFVSGSFDRRIRLWDIIPDGTIREWTQTSEVVSSSDEKNLFHTL
jgi:WD40 repeat protein